jgi:hypothetical protein
MSNQPKAEFVNVKFHIQSFWGGHGKFHQIPDLY